MGTKINNKKGTQSTMDFSEFLESIQDPLYEVKGEKKCPEGFKYDSKIKKCVPATKNGRGDVPGDAMPEPLDTFQVWGASGLNGDGYAMEESLDLTAHKYMKRIEKREKENKEQDDRMRYGKSGKPPEKPLRRGEVKRWDDIEKRWVSNKEGK